MYEVDFGNERIKMTEEELLEWFNVNGNRGMDGWCDADDWINDILGRLCIVCE